MKLRVMYVQPSLKKISAWLLLVLLLGTACLYAQDKASKPKDIILVVDISRSMIGYGNNGEQTANIFPDVIKSLELFVNELKPGDTLSLIRFGKTVYPVKKYTVTGEGDLEKIKAAVLAVGAKDHSTYTAKMLRALKSYLEKIDTKDKSKERLQLAVIFTDALDDPPQGKEKANIGAVTTTIESSDPATRYMYYFSLNKDISENLKSVVGQYFPNIVVSDINGENSLGELSQNVIDNLRPLIEVSVKTTPYKPLQPNVFPIEITANKEADGLQAEVTLQQGEENYLSLSSTTLTLKEGLNTIQLNSDIPVRFEGDWAAKLNFKINTELESIVKPSNPTEFSVTALPLTLTEKTLHRAEFYIPALIILLLLLAGLIIALYRFIRYITFTPVLELHHWETTEEEEKSGTKGKFDAFSFNADRKIADLLTLEPGKYTVSSDSFANPFIYLEGLKKQDDFSFKISGESKRKTKFALLKEEKFKIKTKKNFTGTFAKDGSYFKVGKYSFAVKTNI